LALHAKDDKWRSGQNMVVFGYKTPDDAGAHQAAMNCVDDGYVSGDGRLAFVEGGRSRRRTIALFTHNAGRHEMYFINGFAMVGYKKFD